jgi:hypothetical protein
MDVLDTCLNEIVPLVDTRTMAERIVELCHIEAPTDFDSFEASARYLRRLFASAGADAEILRFPADGVTPYHMWTAPTGFRTNAAVCSIVEPAACAKVLGDRRVEPNTAIVGTGYTGPEGIEAETVHIKHQAAFSQMDIRGKIAYCSSLNPFSIRRQVIQGGGLAIVSSYTDRPQENHARVKWVNTWDAQSDGWLPTADAGKENLPGISISPDMGDYLEACLDTGPVRLRVVTEGEYFAGQLPGVLSATPGTDGGHVLLTGHLYEPGLVDNASGVITCLTASEILCQLGDSSGTRQLVRGLLNYHGQECYGVLALQQYHPGMLKDTFTHLNVDMVGRGKLPLELHRGLDASIGFGRFLLDLILRKAHRIAPTCSHKSHESFQINCTILADPALGGIPTCGLAQPSPLWHTSGDRPGTEELDHGMLRFAALAVTTWAYFLVTASEPEARWLLGRYKREFERSLTAGRERDTELCLDLAEREMLSIAEIVSHERRSGFRGDVCGYVAGLRQELGYRRVIRPAGTRAEVLESRRLYPRALRGGPAVAAGFTEAQLHDIGQPKWSTLHFVLKSWADGSRSIYDIARLASYETGQDLSLARVLTFFQHYAQQGIVSLSADPVLRTE